MGLVTKEVREHAATIELVMELQAKLMDAHELAREVARRLERTPPRQPTNVVAFQRKQAA